MFASRANQLSLAAGQSRARALRAGHEIETGACTHVYQNLAIYIHVYKERERAIHRPNLIMYSGWRQV